MNVAKAEWGTKRECPDCGARFYDLGKEQPLICPKCTFEFEPEIVLKPKRMKPQDEEVTKVVEVEKADSDTKDEDKDDIEELTGDDDALLETDDDDDDDGDDELPGDDDDDDKLLEIDDDDDMDDDIADETNSLEDPDDLPVDDDDDPSPESDENK